MRASQGRSGPSDPDRASGATYLGAGGQRVTVRVYAPQPGAHVATEYDTGTATVHQLRLVADGHADIPLWRQGVWIEAGALVILLLASIRLGSKRGG